VEKLIWLVWREQDDDGEAVGDRLLDAARGLVDGGGAGTPVHGLTAWVEAPEAGAMRWGEDARGLVLTASAAAWVDRVEERGPIEDAIAGVGAAHAGYVVVESSPIEYGDARVWSMGERSPGVSIVTAFARVDGLADADFYGIWHGSHTPLTFELHPMWQYLRHAVLRGLTPGAPRFDAMVHESCRTMEDLLDPMRFFGAHDRESLKTNIDRVNTDLARFADRATLQTTPMHETILRAPPWW
jgi:hypothetical protein